MKARLVCRYGPDHGTEHTLGREAVIGRGEDSSVVLAAPEVSQRHARIWFDDERGAYFVEDLGSLNGTRLDGLRVERPERLGRLHVLSFAGASEFFFVELDRGPEEAAEPAAGPAAARPEARSEDAVETTRIDAAVPAVPEVLRAAAEERGTRVEEQPVGLPEVLARQKAAAEDRKPEAGPAPRPEPPRPESPEPGRPVAAGPLLEIDLAGGARRFPLREGDNLLGRASRVTIRLRNRELSRRHATLRLAGGRVFLRDEGSRNKTCLNGEPLRAGVEVEVPPGAGLRFGRIEARLVSAEDADRDG